MSRESATRPPVVLVASRAGESAARQEKDACRLDAMVDRLGEGGFDARRVAIGGRDGLLEAIGRHEPDMAFCSFFRMDGEAAGEGYLREAFVAAGVAWIGSPSDTMELALSKPRMKALWRSCSIPTPDWLIVSKRSDGSVEGLERVGSIRGFPYIVKPASEGNSRGIDERSVARNAKELAARAEAIAEEYGEAIVERFVSGGEGSREFTAAMIGNGFDAIVAPVEILRPGKASPVISEDDKDSHATDAVPIDDPGLRAKIERLARKVFLASGTRDYARCDILLHEGKLYAIELNGQPLVPDPWFAACALEEGLDEAQYVNAIALAAISGNAQTGHAFVQAPRELERLLPKEIYERLAKAGRPS